MVNPEKFGTGDYLSDGVHPCKNMVVSLGIYFCTKRIDVDDFKPDYSWCNHDNCAYKDLWGDVNERER